MTATKTPAVPPPTAGEASPPVSTPQMLAGGRVPQRMLNKIRVDDDCWLWVGKIDRHGYGWTSLNGRDVQAHRTFYELVVGPIPDGHQIDHLCRVRCCVNPTHMEPVTSRENTMRSPVAPSAVNAAKTECPKGHPYDETNTVVTQRRNGKAYRACRTCRQEQAAARERNRPSRKSPVAGSRAPAGAPVPAGARRHIEPLDPASPKGKELAARLSRVLADIEDEIATRPKTKPA